MIRRFRARISRKLRARVIVIAGNRMDEILLAPGKKAIFTLHQGEIVQPVQVRCLRYKQGIEIRMPGGVIGSVKQDGEEH